jgi:NAD(P)-dependent dehydrogenase (short-subunit alcohol dehydrogenase family)
MKRFKGKPVLVTRGNSGIGLATAQAPWPEGARGVISGRDRTLKALISQKSRCPASPLRFTCRPFALLYDTNEWIRAGHSLLDYRGLSLMSRWASATLLAPFDLSRP